MNQPITVSGLNEQIKGLLETTFTQVYVEGEISNLTYHNSGHIYFSIKDEKSTISCVMFKGNARYLKFRLEVGQSIVIRGSITVYTPRGNYQLLCSKIEPSGVGELALAYEQLKTKLQIKGYFDSAIKKQLPKFPQIIYVVTSNTGAAIEDMKKVLAHRYPLAKMILVPTIVQGENSKYSIEKGIYTADSMGQQSDAKSIIIVGRGGGSIEDLWGFNEEIVATAIYEAKTPIVSAVGHESDFVISDFVADVRASTPSNAIQISTPDINELRIYLDTLNNDLSSRFRNFIVEKEQTVNYLQKSFSQHSLEKKFEFMNHTINHTKVQLTQNFATILRQKQNELLMMEQNFKTNHPSSKEKKGFVQLTKDNIIEDLENLEQNDIITLQSSHFSVDCKVIEKRKLQSIDFE
jgi:exodeoxyribonuclease VII large subunit